MSNTINFKPTIFPKPASLAGAPLSPNGPVMPAGKSPLGPVIKTEDTMSSPVAKVESNGAAQTFVSALATPATAVKAELANCYASAKVGLNESANLVGPKLATAKSATLGFIGAVFGAIVTGLKKSTAAVAAFFKQIGKNAALPKFAKTSDAAGLKTKQVSAGVVTETQDNSDIASVKGVIVTENEVDAPAAK